jgi:phosphatidylglycerophosphate synthase
MKSQSDVGSKLEMHHENPLDIGFTKIAQVVSPTLFNLGVTPNMVTTLSVVASYLAIRSIYLGQPKQYFVLWAILAYMFDCVDGYLARKFDMCTVFGDYYDHVSDVMYVSLLLYVAFWKRGLTKTAKKFQWLIFAIFIIAIIGMLTHMGVQEDLYSKKNQSPTLKVCSAIAKKVCSVSEKCVVVSRWFGVGTFIALMILLITLTVR